MPTDPMNALCIVRGMLVIAEVSKAPEGQGRCHFCGSQTFHERYGWLECDCGDFSILKAHHEKVVQGG
jgi:hypothetical protein